MITFDPLIPLPLWFPLALLAGGLMVAYALGSHRRLAAGRWRAVVGLMSIALAIPLVLLLNPQWVESLPPPPGKPLLTVLVDGSASMATEDGDQQRPRYAVAADWAKQLSDQLGKAFEVQVRLFGESWSEVPVGSLSQHVPAASVTDLAGTLEAALGDDRPQGQAVLLVSDGIDTTGAPAARLREVADKAKALNVPVMTRTVGTQQGVRDLDVSLGLSQELAFVGQRIPVAVKLTHTGGSPATSEVSLSLEGEPVATEQVALIPGGETEVVFYVSQPASGLYRYQATAAPLADEVTELNNTATLLLRVVDEPVRVLILEGKPYWDSKFLFRSLSADPSIELVSVVQMAPSRLLERRISLPARGEKTDPPTDENAAAADAETDADATAETATSESATEPASETATAETKATPQVQSQWEIHDDAQKFLADKERLASFQIVVLGRNTEAFLTDEAITQLRRWLQAGDGSLVCFRGPPTSQINQRLGALLPVRWSPANESRFRVQLTESGEALRWLPESAGGLSAMPSLASTAQPEEPKPLTTVLATSAGEGATPLFTYRPEGKGRVVVIEGAGMWRWAFLPPEHQQRDEVFGDLWRSLIRWLVSNVGLLPNESLALRPDAVTFRATQTATATLLLREEQWKQPPRVELSGASLEQPQTVAPIPQGESGGVYRVSFGQLPEGSYTARTVTTDDSIPAVETTFDVTSNLKERLDLVARPDVLEDLARRSGGSVLPSDSPADVARLFEEHLARSRPQRVVRTAAWDRWWILVAICGMWGMTWGVRRWSGLI